VSGSEIPTRAPNALTGRALAARQLKDLERATSQYLEVLAEPTKAGEPFLVSLETSGIPRGSGIAVRERERFRIYVSDSFPFNTPSVFADHRRWARTPHVQWGSFLCLYAATSVEWNAADGMRGLIDRLLVWLVNAAAGTLDPDDRPLHPPSTSLSAKAGRLIVHPDLGDRVPWAPIVSEDFQGGSDLVFGWCVRHGERTEVLEWVSLIEAYDKVLDENLNPSDERGRPHFVMPLLMVDTHLGWEYPNKARELAGHLEEAGWEVGQLLDIMVRTARMNRLVRFVERDRLESQQHEAQDNGSDDGQDEQRITRVDGKHDITVNIDGDPLLLGLATPGRRVEADRLAHIVAWKIDDLGTSVTSLLRQLERLDEPPAELVEDIAKLVAEWIDNAKVAWVRVHEMRPEITRRRDEATSAAWLRGRRVLLLGAGAVGAVVAEHSVRAGVKRLDVVDNGVVSPGILVRQPYYDADIGEVKVEALAARLNQIVRDDVVVPVEANCQSLLANGQAGGEGGFALDIAAYDLVIDATADAGTRAVIERVRARARADWPSVVTLLLGHQATRGLATICQQGASAGSHDLLRRVALRRGGMDSRRWGDIVDDFFPDPPRSKMFFPEPGCSEPTFIGSASDVAALASSMLSFSLDLLAGPEDGGSIGGPPMAAGGFRLPNAQLAVEQRAAVEELTWHDDMVGVDSTSGFEVRVSAEALAEMHTEVRRGARTRGGLVETGGMMLGTFDEAAWTVNVDLATGPSPDSLLSQSYFLHGVEGTQDFIDALSEASGGLSRFVGIWHSHPFGEAAPSPTDRAGMVSLTSFTSGARRALMLILGGDASTWKGWRDAGTTRPDLFVRVVERNTPVREPSYAPNGQVIDALTPYEALLQVPPPGTYYAGGYSDGGGAIGASDDQRGRRAPKARGALPESLARRGFLGRTRNR
jgi:integrative and conjugative element protein (TIGR02256 family)